MLTEEDIHVLLTRYEIRTTIRRVCHFEHDLYPAKMNHRFDLTLQHLGRAETFSVFTGQGWHTITPAHALRIVLDHVEEVAGAPNLDYWLKQCSGDDLLHAVVEDMSPTEAGAFQQAYFDYCQDMETRLQKCLGEELWQEFFEGVFCEV